MKTYMPTPHSIETIFLLLCQKQYLWSLKNNITKCKIDSQIAFSLETIYFRPIRK